ncbi:MAG: hypothetical protein GEU81_01120 [Nitriliruptorales bacterium]|nr:hypothetical protein [Nitriliruptorales bacterium]
MWLPRLLALALLVGLTASACTPQRVAEPLPVTSPDPSPSATSGPARDTFRYAIQEPASILPGDVADDGGLAVVDAVFDSLTTWDPEGTLIPAAAARWESNDEATVWTFNLRPGATWHGPERDPVTAADFVYAWNRAVADGVAGYHLEDVAGYGEVRDGSASSLSGVRALDERTLEVRLSGPFADFPAVVAHAALGPLPRERLEADPEGFALAPIGNGPFALAEPWAKEQFIRVSRYERWRNGERAALAEVLFQIRDPETAYVAFQQGRMDFTTLPPAVLDQARERYAASEAGRDSPDAPTVLDDRSAELYFLGMDLETPPFDRVEVRRALSLAIDREAIARAVRSGNADPARAAAPAAVPDARLRTCNACRYDPDIARQMLAEADVTELELWFNPGGGHEQVAELLTEQLADVGVTLTARKTEDGGDGAFAAYLQRLRERGAGLFRFGWILDYPILDDALRPLLSGSLAGADGAANYGRYRQEDVDELLDRARAELDVEERHRLYLEAESLALNRDQALIPVVTFRHSAVVSERFEGFELSPVGLADLSRVRPPPKRRSGAPRRRGRRWGARD